MYNTDSLNNNRKEELDKLVEIYLNEEKIENYNNFNSYLSNIILYLNNYKQYGISYLSIGFILLTLKYVDNTNYDRYVKDCVFAKCNDIIYMDEKEFRTYKKKVKDKKSLKI